MAIFNEGNVNVRGFSRFGSAPPPGVTAPAIKIVELIHTQEGPQVGELVDLPAGISGSKILDIKTVAQVGSLFETVSSHRKSIMSKLQVKNTAGLIRAAFEKDILPMTSISLTA